MNNFHKFVNSTISRDLKDLAVRMYEYAIATGMTVTSEVIPKDQYEAFGITKAGALKPVKKIIHSSEFEWVIVGAYLVIEIDNRWRLIHVDVADRPSEIKDMFKGHNPDIALLCNPETRIVLTIKGAGLVKGNPDVGGDAWSEICDGCTYFTHGDDIFGRGKLSTIYTDREDRVCGYAYTDSSPGALYRHGEYYNYKFSVEIFCLEKDRAHFEAVLQRISDRQAAKWTTRPAPVSRVPRESRASDYPLNEPDQPQTGIPLPVDTAERKPRTLGQVVIDFFKS